MITIYRSALPNINFWALFVAFWWQSTKLQQWYSRVSAHSPGHLTSTSLAGFLLWSWKQISTLPHHLPGRGSPNATITECGYKCSIPFFSLSTLDKNCYKQAGKTHMNFNWFAMELRNSTPPNYVLRPYLYSCWCLVLFWALFVAFWWQFTFRSSVLLLCGRVWGWKNSAN